MGDTPIPYAAYAIVGTIIWQTFVDALNSPLRTVNCGALDADPHQFPARGHPALRADAGRVQFPRAARAARRGFCRVPLKPPATAPLFFVGMMSVALTGFMIGLILTPIGLLYGDVQHGLPIASTFLMLLTPVLYPVPASGSAASRQLPSIR